MKKGLIWALLLALLATASAQTVFEGSVVSGESAFVAAAFGGMVESLSVSAGDRVQQGQKVGKLATTKVYAPCDGTVSGVFGQEGDATEGVTERYGAVLYLEPVRKYTITATTEKAYNLSENKFVHIGETVYLCCTADGSHQGSGLVTGFSEDGKSFFVEVCAGEFCMEETVGIFRGADHAAATRIGRGTVAATAPVAVKASGSILDLHVENGDPVERGELLFETVTGTLDGLYAPGSEIVCDCSGIVSSVDAPAGTAVEKGGKLFTVYPDEALAVSVPVAEADLSLISVGQKVRVEFAWDPEQTTLFDGEVVSLSYVNSAESGEPVYAAKVAFEPDDSVRIGMTVLVYTLEDAANGEDGE